MDSITKVNKLCKSVLKITDEDINAVEQMAQEQSQFTHPFKRGKQVHYNDLGDHNIKVINALKDLRNILTNNQPPEHE